MAVEYSVLLFCGAVLRVPPAGGRGPDDEHRNAVRVRDRVRRRVGDAGEASGPAPSLPNAVGAGGAGRRHARQLRADVLAGRIELASADHLAGDRTGDLLRLWTQAQPPSERLRFVARAHRPARPILLRRFGSKRPIAKVFGLDFSAGTVNGYFVNSEIFSRFSEISRR